MDLAFKDKVVVITGAGRGIGRATARMLAAEGAMVGIIDNMGESANGSAKELTDQFGVKSLGVATDIANYGDVVRARDELAAALGPAEVLINCAAIVEEQLFLDSKPEDWQRVVSVGLFGAMNCLHAFIPPMVERGRGRVICLATDAARIGQSRISVYAAAKGGVVALCKSLAQEVGGSGVTINVVSPGTTNTELRQHVQAKIAAELGPERYERRTKNVLKRYPTGRIGEPDDIASAILFLASDRSAWTTGQVLSVNGGFAMP